MFKLQKFTAEEIKSLPQDLQDAYAEMKRESDNFDKDLAEIFSAPDDIVSKAITAQLAKQKKAAPAPKAAPAKAATTKVDAAIKAKKAAPKADTGTTSIATERKKEAKKLEDMDGELTEEQVLAIARRFNEEYRSRRSQIVDGSSTHGTLRAPTKRDLITWLKSPGKSDMIGVDQAPKDKRLTPNVNLARWKKAKGIK